MVGFLLIGHPPNVAEGFDYYIQESYVIPKFRNKGLMSKKLELQFSRFKGRYCMYILDKNYKAKQFWNKIIPRFNGAWIPEVDDPMPEPGCSIYGFEV